MYTIKRVVASYKVLDEIGASRMAVACFLRLAVASMLRSDQLFSFSQGIHELVSHTMR